ncbi:6-O-methylguanine DNA methyltransferase, DNA binding domain containing protein [Elaphomyces granulatus]
MTVKTTRRSGRSSILSARTKVRPRDSKTSSTIPQTRNRGDPLLNNNKNTPSAEIDSVLVASCLARITAHPTLTPYRRRVYRTLLSVPPGRWTTYSALSRHLGSGPRAIGTAMRTNPFAPEVPCHRVLATDRTVGGYKGEWNNGGEYCVEKRKLLEDEGVRFDEKGRAGGECFTELVDLESLK